MFRYDEKSSCYWFTNMAVDNLAEFNLVGVVSFVHKVIIKRKYSLLFLRKRSYGFRRRF